MDIVKTFDAMYVADKIYDYSNYVNMYCESGVVYFEMCIILDGASRDCMVRLYHNSPATQDFERLAVNFNELKLVIKTIKGNVITLIPNDSNLTIESDGSTHTMELSTIIIPTVIRNTLDDFKRDKVASLVDFNFLKLYNNMNELINTLTINTLQKTLYGIMNHPEGLMATDGYCMHIINDGMLKEAFLFPRHSVSIMKLLPKVGVRYAILDHRIYLFGAGFEVFIGEWEGGVDYPTEPLLKHARKELTIVNDGKEVMAAIKRCMAFSDVVEVYPGIGEAISKKGRHKEYFTSTPEFGDERILFHINVVKNTIEPLLLEMSTTDKKGRILTENSVYVFLGMRDDDE